MVQHRGHTSMVFNGTILTFLCMILSMAELVIYRKSSELLIAVSWNEE